MKPIQQNSPLTILFADDDKDDCFFFEKAVKESSLSTSITIVNEGEELMKYLFENTDNLPDVLFLDISMPRKTGFECLEEIKRSEKLKNICVIMFSTFYTRDLNYERGMITMLKQIGAYDYITKPTDFEKLKQTIHKTLIKIIDKMQSKEEEKIL